MQYILTQSEYNKLKAAEKKAEEAVDKKELMEFCEKVANKMPVTVKWMSGPPSPWECIKSKKNWYCDCCPCRKICPEQHKNWSK